MTYLTSPRFLTAQEADESTVRARTLEAPRRSDVPKPNAAALVLLDSHWGPKHERLHRIRSARPHSVHVSFASTALAHHHALRPSAEDRVLMFGAPAPCRMRKDDTRRCGECSHALTRQCRSAEGARDGAFGWDGPAHFDLSSGRGSMYTMVPPEHYSTVEGCVSRRRARWRTAHKLLPPPPTHATRRQRTRAAILRKSQGPLRADIEPRLTPVSCRPRLVRTHCDDDAEKAVPWRPPRRSGEPRWTTRATHLMSPPPGTVSCPAVRSPATGAPRPRYGLERGLVGGWRGGTAAKLFVIHTHTSSMHSHWRCWHAPAAGDSSPHQLMHRQATCAASAHTRLQYSLHPSRPPPRPAAVVTSGGVPRQRPCVWSEPLRLRRIRLLEDPA
jgi:hypothetical protein